jgi:predicted nucleic acid-binding protein
VRIYLDLCCLKRPFDRQDQPLVRLQTEAVLSLLALPPATVELLRSEAQLVENSLNPVQGRREAVAAWLSQGSLIDLSGLDVERRIQELIHLGFKSFDAFHLASAELAQATALVTTDSRLLHTAARHTDKLTVRVIDPVHLLEELSQWTPPS